MGLPKFVDKKLHDIKVKLNVQAELAKQSNPDESMYKNLEENILETIPIQYMYLISSLIGSILIAIGTLALCLVLLLSK
jgi:hypothetical protein